MSKAQEALRAMHETGEADQDYDQKFYDAICKKLKASGFGNCTHREFDKYQGVYISVPGFGKIWTKDVYYTGKKKDSGSGGTFTYEKGTETEHVLLWPDGESEDFDLEVTRKGDKVDATQLTSYLRSKAKGKK